MKRSPLSLVLATGMFVIGCPRPGLPPEETGTTTGAGGAGGTTSDTTTSDTCSVDSCMNDEVRIVTVAETGFDVGADVRVASDGSALVAGARSPSEGDPDAFAMRVGADGVVQWTAVLHQNTNEQHGRAIAQSDTTLFVAGAAAFSQNSTDQDGFVTRLNANGAPFAESAVFQSSGLDEVDWLAADGTKGVFAVGSLSDVATGPPGTPASFGDEDDIFLTHLDQDGTASWTVVLPVAPTADQPTIVGGYARAPDKHRGLLGLTVKTVVSVPMSDSTTENLQPVMMADPSDGALLVFDETLLTTACVTKVLRFASNGADTVDAVAADADPSWVYVAGKFSGDGLAIEGTLVGNGEAPDDEDVYIAKVQSSTGELGWVRRFGGPGPQGVGGLAFSGTAVYFAGTFDAAGASFDDPDGHTSIPVTHTGGVDFVVVRIDRSTGVVTPLATSSGSGDEWPAALAVDGGVIPGKPAYWITGDFIGDLAFQGKTATSKGSYDGFLFRVPL